MFVLDDYLSEYAQERKGKTGAKRPKRAPGMKRARRTTSTVKSARLVRPTRAKRTTGRVIRNPQETAYPKQDNSIDPIELGAASVPASGLAGLGGGKAAYELFGQKKGTAIAVGVGTALLGAGAAGYLNYKSQKNRNK